MLLAFVVVPERAGRARTVLRIARIIGAVALVVLALVFRTGDGEAMLFGPLWPTSEAGTVWLRHSWWGILGLIGWTYLVAAVVYLVVGSRREWLVGAAACLLLFYFAADSAFVERQTDRSYLGFVEPLIRWIGGLGTWIDAHVSIGSTLGSLASITVAGCCLGAVLARPNQADPVEDRTRTGAAVNNSRATLRWALGFAAGLFVVGVITDGPYGINKIRATPAWCCYCAALTVAAWALWFWLVDVRGVRSWTKIVAPAGANPLLAYLLHPLVFLLAGLGGDAVSSLLFFYKSPQLPAIVAVVGSLAMALLLVQATGWIARAGFRLKV
jgi:heparan-alpha-glucosaminide N-acetyltransferase